MQHAGLVMVDFGADWCPPCRLIAPVVERLAVDYAGRARIATLDTDANPATAARYAVRNLPTLLFFRDGQVVDRVFDVDAARDALRYLEAGAHFGKKCIRL